MEDLKSDSSNFCQTEFNSEKFSSGKVYTNDNDNNNNNNNSIPSRTKASLSENMNSLFLNYGWYALHKKSPKK